MLEPTHLAGVFNGRLLLAKQDGAFMARHPADPASAWVLVSPGGQPSRALGLNLDLYGQALWFAQEDGVWKQAVESEADSPAGLLPGQRSKIQDLPAQTLAAMESSPFWTPPLDQPSRLRILGGPDLGPVRPGLVAMAMVDTYLVGGESAG